MHSRRALSIAALAVLGGCSRGAPGDPPGRATAAASAPALEAAGPPGAAPPVSATPQGKPSASASPGGGPDVKKGAPMITAYFGFSPPTAWATVEPRPMTMGKPRYELPRSKPGDPVVALKEGFVHARSGPDGDEDAGAAPASDPLPGVVAGWQKRLGAITPSRRGQPLDLYGPGSIERVGEAPVVFVEHVAKGRAFLGAAVDLSSVDARTQSAYFRVSALTFELEGPAATVLAAKADFEALVRSVHLTK